MSDNMTQQGITLDYFEAGVDNQPAVVLLHGAAGLHRLWMPQLDPFSERYHVLAPDLLYEDLRQMTIQQLAADVATLIRERIGGPAHIVGLSFGAVVGTQLAITAPELISSVTISGGRVRADFNDKIGNTLLRLIPESRLTRMFVAQMLDVYPELGDAAQEDMEKVGKAGFMASVQAIGQVDFTGQLSGITAPAMILVGNLDRPVFIKEATRLYEGIPNAVLQIIPDMGHGWNLEEPELFTEVVTEFIDSVENGQFEAQRPYTVRDSE